jgi:hypothetical protein
MEIEHKNTPELICPHCGHEHDGLEYRDGELEVDGYTTDCESCEKEFTWSCRVEFYYSTKKTN